MKDRLLKRKRSLDPEWRKGRAKAQKKHADMLRLSAIAAYGGLVCSCDHHGKPCGPKPIEFLAIDHINGKGKTEKARAGKPLYRILKKLNYPKGYRVLCHNCNFALGRWGHCPMSDSETQEMYKPPTGKDHWRFGKWKPIHFAHS